MDKRHIGYAVKLLNRRLDQALSNIPAIRDNEMAWVHVSDLNGFDNPAAHDYAVRGIPSNFLLDKQGTIIARDLHGKAID